MNKFVCIAIAFGTVCVSRAIGALGKDLPLLETQIPDSLYFEGGMNRPYRDSASLAQILASHGGLLLHVDSVKKVVRLAYGGVFLRRDSVSKLVEIRKESYGEGGYRGLDIKLYSYDAQGRVVGITQTMGDTSNGWDTARYVWSHPGCADRYTSTSRDIWSVDADGRCLRSMSQFRSRSGADTSWSSGYKQDSLVWAGGRLLNWLYGNREKVVYTHDATGLTQADGYTREGYGPWFHDHMNRFRYASGMLTDASFEHYDSTGATTFFENWSKLRPTQLPLSSTGIHAGLQRSGAVTVRREATTLQFANAGSEAVEIQVSTARGELVGRLRLEAGREASLSVSGTSAMLVWSAKGRTAGAHGTVLPGR